MQGWRKDESNSFPLCFGEGTFILLDLEEQEIDPWKILPLVSPPRVSTDLHNTIPLIHVLKFIKVTSEDVSKFKVGQRIPHCSYEFQLLPGKDFKRLLHKVTLTGISSPNSFHIRYPQPEGESQFHIEVVNFLRTCCSMHATLFNLIKYKSRTSSRLFKNTWSVQIMCIIDLMV